MIKEQNIQMWHKDANGDLRKDYPTTKVNNVINDDGDTLTELLSTINTSLGTKIEGKTLRSGDLNDIKTAGFYNSGGANTCTNKPSDCDHFGMIVTHNAYGTYHSQVLFEGDEVNKVWIRTCLNDTWSAWERFGQNTWRGIQNNLTSTSTTDSLSANQGKVLKGEIDAIKTQIGDADTTSTNLANRVSTVETNVTKINGRFEEIQPDLIYQAASFAVRDADGDDIRQKYLKLSDMGHGIILRYTGEVSSTSGLLTFDRKKGDIVRLTTNSIAGWTGGLYVFVKDTLELLNVSANLRDWSSYFYVIPDVGEVVTLNNEGKIDIEYMPFEYMKVYATYNDFPQTSYDPYCVYVAADTGKQYRIPTNYDGYVEITKSNLILGESSQNAFRGDYGKELYDNFKPWIGKVNYTGATLTLKRGALQVDNGITSRGDIAYSSLLAFKGYDNSVTPKWYVDQIKSDLATTKERLEGYVYDSKELVLESGDTIPSMVDDYNVMSGVKGAVLKIEGDTVKSDNVANGTKIITSHETVMFVNLPLGTYTFKAFNGPDSAFMQVFEYTDDKSDRRQLGGTVRVTNSITFTNTLRTVYLYVNASNFDLMIVKGTTAPTQFVPYFNGLEPTSDIFSVDVDNQRILDFERLLPSTSLSLNGFGNYRDSLEVRENARGLYDVYKVVRTKTITLNGSENWYKATDSVFQLWVVTTATLPSNSNNWSTYCVSNYGSGTADDTWSGVSTGFAVANEGNGIKVQFRTEKDMGIEEMKSLLVSKNAVITYAIANPIETKILSNLTLEQITAKYDIGSEVILNYDNTIETKPKITFQVVYKKIGG